MPFLLAAAYGRNVSRSNAAGWWPYVFVLLKAGVAFAAGAVGTWALTRDWGRGLSYAAGFTTVLVVGDSLRLYRGRREEGAKDEPGGARQPVLFDNG